MIDQLLDEIEKIALDVTDSVADALVGPATTLTKASSERSLVLPQDHYGHNDVQTEWWYYTGHLQSGEQQFGFELVFFKRHTALDRIGQLIPMRLISEINYYAHFAVTDISEKRFRYAHRRSINGGRDAGALTDSYKVWLDDWCAREVNGHHLITATMNKTKLDLVLKPTKPPIKQGLDGLSYKDVGEASYYLSYTRMLAEGELIVGGKPYQVTGSAWMDHEFGTWQMKEKVLGWDWFALQLDNNQELMAYVIRGADNNPTNFSEAAFIDSQGHKQRLFKNDFTITNLAEWQSPQTNTVYPSGWRIDIPALEAHLTIEPVLKCQELDTRGSTMVIYWEGAATVQGRLMGQPITGRAYVELVGHDRSHENLSFLDYVINEIKYREMGF